LQAAIRLALHWVERGQRNVACDLLAPVHSWFTESFEAEDLKEAKALRDELGGV
jgi:hypothetical protein